MSRRRPLRHVRASSRRLPIHGSIMVVSGETANAHLDFAWVIGGKGQHLPAGTIVESPQRGHEVQGRMLDSTSGPSINSCALMTSNPLSVADVSAANLPMLPQLQLLGLDFTDVISDFLAELGSRKTRTRYPSTRTEGVYCLSLETTVLSPPAQLRGGRPRARPRSSLWCVRFILTQKVSGARRTRWRRDPTHLSRHSCGGSKTHGSAAGTCRKAEVMSMVTVIDRSFATSWESISL